MVPGMIGRRPSFYFTAAALTLSHQPARAADEPVRLAPSSTWQLDYADDSCRLARQFGEGERKNLLVIERFGPGDPIRVTVSGDTFRRVRSGKEATLRFGPAESEQDVAFMKGDWGGTPALIFTGPLRIAPNTEQEEEAREALEEANQLYLFEPASISPERERAVTFVSVDVSGVPEVVFETGSLGESFAALRKCTDELLTHWGIDVKRHKSLSRKAVPAGRLKSGLHPRIIPAPSSVRERKGLFIFV